MARGRRRRNDDYGDDAGEHLNGAGEDRVELANSDARADTIRAAVRFIAGKQAEIASIREELNEYKQKHIKGDLGMKLADFAAVYRVSQLEFEDRDKLLDTIREGFRALGIGDTVDWVAAAQEGAHAPSND